MANFFILPFMRASHWPLWVLILATGLAYSNSFPGAFHYDDYPLMLETPLVREQPFPGLAFLEHYGGRPLTLWTFHWNFHFFGEEPWSYHLVNLVLHLIVVAAVYLAGLRMGAHFGLAAPRLFGFAAALLFALHPLQSQAVNYIWSRSVLLMLALGLLALLTIERRPWLALVLFQLAVWSRTDGLMLAPFLVLMSPRNRRMVALLAGLNVGAFLVSMLRYAPAELGWKYGDAVGFWAAQPQVLGQYLKLLVQPGGLSVDHDFQARSLWYSLAWLGALSAAATAIWRARRRHPLPALAAAWIVVLLLPSLLIPNPDLVNESRFYPVMVGVVFLAAYGLMLLSKRAAGIAPGARLPPLGLVIGGLMLLAAWATPATLARNRLWQSDRALWQDAAAKYPSKGRIQYNLGVALVHEGDLNAAESAFRKAVDLNPLDDLSYAALGYCFEIRGEKERAQALYRQALKLNEENAYARDALDRMAAGDLKN